MAVVAKSLALFLLTIAAFIVDAYASSYLAEHVFSRTVPRPYSEMVSSALIGSVAAAALCSYPLVRLYAHRAWIAGLVVASPMVFLRATDAYTYVGEDAPRVLTMSWVEMLVYPATILVAVWIANGRRAERHTSAV